MPAGVGSAQESGNNSFTRLCFEMHRPRREGPPQPGGGPHLLVRLLREGAEEVKRKE